MSVYHYGHTGSCNHKAHLTNTPDAGQDDHQAALRHLAPALPVLAELIPESALSNFIFTVSPSFSSFPSPQSRGPPVLV
jgi:hypothetical protein